MTDHTTHDLAIARAERDAWQSTCEELHRAIAGRDVEIESHLGRCEAADQRARSLDAALTAERMGYVDVCDAIAAETHGPAHAASIARETRRERDRLRAEVDDLTVTRDRLLAREHEDGRLHAQLRAELAELRARPVLTEDLLRGALDAHGYAGLTRKLFAHIGPVTLPSPDRAEDLTAAIYGDSFSELRVTDRMSMVRRTQAALAKLSPAPAPALDAAFLRRVLVATKHGPGGRGNPGPCDAACVKCEAERMAKAAPAREVAPTRVLVHADGGACHGSRVVDGRCVGCGIAPDMQSTSLWLDADARPVQCEPAKVVAPTLVAVSDEELAVAFYSEPERPALRECIDAADLAGIRAVRAKLGAAEVTEERLREAIREERHVSSFVAEDTAKGVLARLRATAAKGG